MIWVRVYFLSLNDVAWPSQAFLFIFFYEKENEPKEIAPCDAAHGPALRFSNQAVAVKLANAQTATASYRSILRCSARHNGGILTLDPLNPRALILILELLIFEPFHF